jgi:hypothetical protein
MTISPIYSDILRVLGIPVETEPSDVQRLFRKQYRELCRRFHPDKLSDKHVNWVMSVITQCGKLFENEVYMRKVRAMGAKARELVEGAPSINEEEIAQAAKLIEDMLQDREEEIIVDDEPKPTDKVNLIFGDTRIGMCGVSLDAA